MAGLEQEIFTRPFQLVTGRVWKGSAFGGAWDRTDVPKIVAWYMEGKINIDGLITHTMPLEDINTAFNLMHRDESSRSVVKFWSDIPSSPHVVSDGQPSKSHRSSSSRL